MLLTNVIKSNFQKAANLLGSRRSKSGLFQAESTAESGASRRDWGNRKAESNSAIYTTTTRAAAAATGGGVGLCRFYSTQKQSTGKTRKMVVKLNEQERAEKLQPLLDAGWTLVDGRDAICKQFVLKDFNQAFSFMTGVALLAEKINHHPEWFNCYNKLNVTLSTHDVGGLSSQDIRMANYFETQANLLK
ncbi:pterin-4-alpha-carbinolamine dehydratase [Drosophila miranda]|uniref:pterin-4-alpha-carbinolamine dehydratase n=1 Tax=Drosophila miranda TaxID=7229 RepID=UPI0007E88E9E|nr:pterin-4-alpha-carbinolamine dehydratase [Drosophila miranda]